MMETMSQNQEQFYKPQAKAETCEEKPQLKLNLNLGGVDDKFNAMLCSPDLKKVTIDTPELDRMVANSSLVFSSSGYSPLPQIYRDDGIAVQGPTVTRLEDGGVPAAVPHQQQQPDGENATRSFIQALREIHEQNDFKSETFNIPATTSDGSPAGALASFSDPAPPPPPPQICSAQSWGNFPAPAVTSYGYNPVPPNYISSAPAYLPPEPLPAYPEPKATAATGGNGGENYLPDLTQIDKLNLSTAEKLQIYSQIPIHEVTDPQLQEQLKAERKKMRNRIAASKCRKRKLQKEAELEDKVKILKKKNTDLSSQLLGLRDEVKELKVKIMTHVNAGCNIKTFGGSGGNITSDMSYVEALQHGSVTSSAISVPMVTQSLTTNASSNMGNLHQGLNLA